MKINYIISRYNYLRDTWEQVYNTYSLKLVKLKLRQYRVAYPYHNFKLYEEVVLVG